MAQQEPISPTAADLMEGERSEATARITRNESAQPRSGGSLRKRGEPDGSPRSVASDAERPAPTKTEATAAEKLRAVVLSGSQKPPTEKPSRFGHRASEFVIESLIRLCGISAII